MDAKAVSVCMNFRQFGNQAIHIHAPIRLARRAAIRGAGVPENLCTCRLTAVLAEREVTQPGSSKSSDTWVSDM